MKNDEIDLDREILRPKTVELKVQLTERHLPSVSTPSLPGAARRPAEDICLWHLNRVDPVQFAELGQLGGRGRSG